MSGARRQADRALAVPAEPSFTVSALPGFDPSRGSLNYHVSWPRPASPCDLMPLWKGEFNSFEDWVSFATTRLTGTTNQYGVEAAPVCVDALGRRCIMGGDFKRARNENAFPVRYFWECVPASAMSAGTAATPKSDAGLQPASAVAESETPEPSSARGEQGQ